MTTKEISERSDKIQKVLDYVAAQKASYKTAEITAKMLGLTSKGQFYDVLKGAWGNVAADVFDRVARQCGAESGWQIVETSNYQRIKGAMLKAANHGDLNALCGDTGTGKTKAAKTLSAIIPNATYILADVTMTKATFLSEILKGLTPQYYNYRGLQSQMSAVCDLLSHTTNSVLVIDDAGKLKESVLSLVQVIYDRTKGSAGVLMLGTEGLYQKIASHSGSNKHFMRELNARLTWGFLDYVKPNEVKDICNQNGITDETAITWLSNATVALHTLENCIKNAKILSEKSGIKIDSDFLTKMNQNTSFFKPESLNFKQRLLKVA
jgi:DNA transposition AAA+ family ATPase